MARNELSMKDFAVSVAAQARKQNPQLTRMRVTHLLVKGIAKSNSLMPNGKLP